MSDYYTAWSTTSADIQLIPPDIWTPVWFTPERLERMPLTDGHMYFKTELYAILPAPVKVNGVKVPGTRPTVTRGRFVRYFPDGTTSVVDEEDDTDETGYNQHAVALEVSSWYKPEMTFIATRPDFTLGFDIKHNGNEPMKLGIRNYKAHNPALEAVHMMIERLKNG